MNPIALIIFDCDGVVVDSELIANRIGAELKTELGFPFTTEEHIRKFTGLGASSASVAELRKKLPADYSKTADARRAVAFAAELREIEGISRLLETLTVPYCLASNGDLEKIKVTLGVTRLYDRFAGRIFHSGLVKNLKPAPDLFLLAARTMGVEPKNCLVLEDSVAGVQAALAAGMAVAGFTGGSHVYPELPTLLKEAGAPYVFKTMSEFASFLDRSR